MTVRASAARRPAGTAAACGAAPEPGPLRRRARLLPLASVALLTATSACKPAQEPGLLMLHARVEIVGDSQDDGTCPGCTHDIGEASHTSERLALTTAQLVRPTVHDGLLSFETVDTVPATFGGTLALRHSDSWYNFEASFSNKIELQGTWRDGTRSTTAAGGPQAQLTMRPMSVSLPMGASDLRARIDIDLPVTGTATGSAFQYAEASERTATAPYADCAVESRHAGRCRFVLALSAAAVEPRDAARLQADRASAVQRADNRIPLLPFWGEDVRGMKIERRPDGTFVARADAHIALHPLNFTQTRTLHIVLWSSDPDDTSSPSGTTDSESPTAP